MGYITIKSDTGDIGIINKDSILAVIQKPWGGKPCVYVYLNNNSCTEVRTANTLNEIIEQL